MRARLEALFIAADHPDRTAAFLADVVDTTTEASDDGQQVITGLGPYVVLEQAAKDQPSGTVTLWLRVDDAAALHDRLVAAGAQSIAGPERVATETVAALRTQHGLRLGFISDDGLGVF
jgi:hypothetical protein